MANESWAGGTISGGAAATSWSLKPRGGYIPVQDVPNAPKTVGMPIYHPPNAPAIKFDYVKGAPDMESRAAKLQQKPLPSSFEEAGEMRAASAGKGQAAYAESALRSAKATTAAGQDIGNAITGIAGVIGKIAEEEKRIRLVGDQIKFDNAADLHAQRLDQIVKTEDPEKWGTLKAEADKNFQGTISSLGAGSRSAQDHMQSKAKGIIDRGELHLQTQGKLKSMGQNIQLAEDKIKNGIAEKRYDKADEGVDDLVAMHHINKDQAKEMKEKNHFLQGLDVVQEAKLNSDSAMRLRDQAEVVIKGGKSKEFEVLNTNPALAPNIKYEADEQLKVLKAKDLKEIEDKIERGELRTSEDIEKAAKGKFFSKATIESLKRSDIVIDPKDSEVAMKDVRAAISEYNPFTDTGGEQYEKIREFIRTHVAKERRAPYTSMLDEKMKKGQQNKSDTPLEKTGAAVIKEISSVSANNMLLDTPEEKADLMAHKRKQDIMKKGVDPVSKKPITKEMLEEDKLKDDKEKVYTPTVKEAAAWYKNAAKERELQEKTDDFIKKNPDAEPDKVWEHVFKGNPNIERSAGESTSAVPRAGKVDVLERERRIAEALNLPAGAGYVGKRDVNKASPAYEKAFVSDGERSDVTATAYTPGRGDPKMEGKKELGGPAKRPGEPYYIEDYVEGKVPHVSVAMDSKSDLQGKYILYSSHPNVVFRVEDVGSAFEGKGDTAIDIASRNDAWRGDYKTDGTIKVISAAEAAEISGTNKLAGGGGTAGSVHPALLAKLAPLEQQFGKLDIKSGYRDIARNAAVGGAGDSEHTRGDAVDINVSSMSKAERLAMIAAANKQGIQGVGVYANTLHFDLGFKHGRRAWGPSHGRESIPQWARPTLVQLGYINA